MLHSTLIGRAAVRDDIAAIRRMQERSIRVLGADCYRPKDLNAFLDAFSTMDDAVVDEGHYFVLVTPGGRIVASAGWSQRPPGYSRGAEQFDPTTATIRSVFVDPDLPRQGLGTRIMRIAEADALAAGVLRLKVSSTLSGLHLYRSLGYRELEHATIPIGEASFALVRMEKLLDATAAHAKQTARG